MTPRELTVIVTHECRGAGTEADPIRQVIRVYSTDGRFIAERDPDQPLPTDIDTSETWP